MEVHHLRLCCVRRRRRRNGERQGFLAAEATQQAASRLRHQAAEAAESAADGRLDAIEASSTALIETLADLQDRSAFASARASTVAALLARSAGTSSSS